MYEKLLAKIYDLIPERREASQYYTARVLQEAADTIEELKKAVYFHKYNSEFWEDKYNSLADEKWVPVTERLPEEAYGCLLIVWDSNPMSGDDFLNYLPYFAGWDGEQWNDGDGIQVPFEVVYWMPLPKTPKEET